MELMNFRGHLTGGIISGATLAIFKLVCKGTLNLSAFPRMAAAIFGITVFFSIFPDLDTNSVPQRWFYRVVFLILIYLGYRKQYELATLLAVISLTPILGQHRGWTHNRLSPFFVPLFLAGIYEYFISKDSFFYDLSFQRIYGHFKNYIWFIIASIIGWYTHLLLDSGIYFFKNNRKHH